MLHEAEGTAHERAVQRQRRDAADDDWRAQANDHGLDDVHESAQIPIPASYPSSIGQSLGGLGIGSSFLGTG